MEIDLNQKINLRPGMKKASDTMLMNSLNNFSLRQTGVVKRKPQTTIRFSACALYCDICSWKTRGIIECRHVLCVLSDFMSYIVQAVNDLILRLHKATCRLLHPQPALVNNVNPLPDILKDLSSPVMNICNTRPDMIPVSSGPCIFSRDISEQSVIIVRSSQQPDIGCCKYHKQFYSHSYHHSNTSNMHRHYNSEDQSFGSNYHKRRNFTDRSDNSTTRGRTTYASVQLQKTARTKSGETAVNPYSTDPYRVSSSAQSICHQLNSSRQRCSNQISRENNNLNQRLMVPEHPTHQIQPMSRSITLDIAIIQDSGRDAQGDYPSGHEDRDLDGQLTMDIVRALRSVGDNLDARMRYENELPFQSMLGTDKISLGWIVCTILKRHGSVEGIVGLSLELIRQFNHL